MLPELPSTMAGLHPSRCPPKDIQPKQAHGNQCHDQEARHQDEPGDQGSDHQEACHQPVPEDHGWPDDEEGQVTRPSIGQGPSSMAKTAALATADEKAAPKRLHTTHAIICLLPFFGTLN